MINERAIDILKNAKGHIELIVAKSKSANSENSKLTSDYSLNIIDNPANSVPNEKLLNNFNSSSNSINDSKNELELNQFLQNEPGNLILYEKRDLLHPNLYLLINAHFSIQKKKK